MAQWLEIGIAQVNEIPTFVSRVLPHIRKKKETVPLHGFLFI